MNEHFDTQRAALHNGQQAHTPPKGTAPTEAVPPLLDKKYLAGRMGCVMPGGAVNRRRLYQQVLTADVLAHIGLTAADVRRSGFKTFTREQSVLLAEKLCL